METYNGHVRTPNDAIILFEACRLGLLPRVQRRLSEKERQSIRSGSVFVWDEREAGMRRWTDGKSWSASRVSGSFLTYREMEGKRGGGTTASTPSGSRAGKTPDSDQTGASAGPDLDAEEGPDGYRYKPDGLNKQSFSITTSQGQHLHLISYFARSQPTAPGLRQPSTDPNLSQIKPQQGMYPESTVNDQTAVPAVTQSPMAGAPAYTMAPSPAPYPPRQGPASHPQPYYPVQAYAPPPGYAYTPPPGYYLQPYPPGPGGLPPPGYPPVYSQHNQQPQLPIYAPSPHAYDQRPSHADDHRSLQPPTLPSSIRPPPPPPPISQANGTSHYSSSQPPTPTYASTHGMSSLPPPPANDASNQSIQIDPRLMNTSQSHPNGPNIQSDPVQRPVESNNNNNNNINLKSPSTASATIAPTIGTMMNGSRTPNPADMPADRDRSPSPGGTKDVSTVPKDIPTEKLGFREDNRTLRMLDAKFAV